MTWLSPPRSEGCTIVNMVRKEEGRTLLRSLGAEHVVVTGEEGWQDQVRQLVKKLNITVAFDAIAGEMTGTMMQLLPSGSTTLVYGGLSGKVWFGLAYFGFGTGLVWFIC